MSKKSYIYSYNEHAKTEDNHAPSELHEIFVNQLVACVMGSEFMTSIDYGLGGVLINLNVNSIKTKYFSPPNVANALGKHFKTLSITGDSYNFEINEKVEFEDNSYTKPSYYKNMLNVLTVAVIDLNNFENEIRDALMSVDSFIKHSPDIIEKHLPHKKYSDMLRFNVAEKNLRLTCRSNIHDFPIERAIEKIVTSRINLSFNFDEVKNKMVPVGPYDLLFDDIFRKRYLRDSEWPYLLYSDLESTCNEIKIIFDKRKTNHKKYNKFFN